MIKKQYLNQIVAKPSIAMPTPDSNIGYDGLTLVTILFNLLKNMLRFKNL